MSLLIEDEIKRRGLTQEQAARLMGLQPSEVSRLVRGTLDGFSLERLLRCALALDQDVDIVIGPKSSESARIRVSGALGLT